MNPDKPQLKRDRFMIKLRKDFMHKAISEKRKRVMNMRESEKKTKMANLSKSSGSMLENLKNLEQDLNFSIQNQSIEIPDIVENIRILISDDEKNVPYDEFFKVGLHHHIITLMKDIYKRNEKIVENALWYLNF